MRAFIGLEIPENIRDLYTSICKPMHKSSNLSFIRRDKMHITLAFFPDLSMGKVQDIKAMLEEINIERFNINCGNIGLFKRKGIPSTIFIKISSETLLEYNNILHDKLNQINIHYDNRKPFTPHITLARIKEVTSEGDFFKDYRHIAKNFTESSFQPENVTLFSSNMINYKKEATIEFINNIKVIEEEI